VRKQYHFRDGPDGLRAWDVDRLVELAKDLPVIQVPLSAVRELDEPYWYGHGALPTCRSVAEHAQLITKPTLNSRLFYPRTGESWTECTGPQKP
jgi:hypothetical protein